MLAVFTTGAEAVSIEIVGPEEVFFDYDTMRCFPEDSPDGNIRPFRDASGQVQVRVGGHTRLIGPDFNNLTHDCHQVMTHHVNPNPADYDYADWLVSTWTEDGQNIYGIVHNEYHGSRIPGMCPGEPFIKCRYNSVTFARSTDAGANFEHGPGPANLLASTPYRYVPGDGRYGMAGPANIVKKDGWFYTLLLITARYKEQLPGVCLIRTQDVTDPKSWRGWDGEAFTVRFIDPYRESPEPISRHLCQPVAYEEIRDMQRSLTYNTFIDKFVLTGTSRVYDPVQGRQVEGFYYSLSDDLIHWTYRQLLWEVEGLGTYVCGDQGPRLYPGITDHDSPDRNFWMVDQNAYLYYTQIVPQSDCLLGVERDMMRIPIRFSP
jgi:hypothetical protein